MLIPTPSGGSSQAEVVTAGLLCSACILTFTVLVAQNQTDPASDEEMGASCAGEAREERCVCCLRVKALQNNTRLDVCMQKDAA